MGQVLRFTDKDRHQVFLEPEGLDTVFIFKAVTFVPFNAILQWSRWFHLLDHNLEGYGISQWHFNDNA